MNLNKYLIAAMLAVGIVGTVSAQENRSHSFKNKQEYQVLEEGASSSADYQTKQMIAGLGLNHDQAVKIQTINLNHAKEIERAKVECGDDYTGFNQYVDKVAFVRDQELKSVLTPEQFAFYTSNKSNKTWLGMDKFKFKSEGLTVKENEHELKIKGKANIASEDISASNNQNTNIEQSSDAYKNSKNIITMPEAKLPDYHNIPKDDATPENSNSNAGAPDLKTYPGGIQIEEIYGVKSEYDDAYNPKPGAEYGNKCSNAVLKKSAALKKSAGKSGHKVLSASSAMKKSVPKNKVAKSSEKPGTNISSTKAKAKGTKSSATAITKKKSSAKGTAAAKSKKPEIPKAKTSGPEENTFSSGQTLTPAPNNDDFCDTVTSEPSNYGSNVDKFNNRSTEPAQENFFINKDSKAKFTDNEIKIKPEKGVKYKITDKEIKLKDGKKKLKENDNEIKIKDGHDKKIKSNGHETKIKSNGHETKIKSGDLKVKIKE